MQLKLLLITVLLLCGCSQKQEAVVAVNSEQTVVDFISERDSYFLVLPNDKRSGRLGRGDSHVGSMLDNCTNSEFYCANAGSISFVAPKFCSNISLEEWRVGGIEAKRIFEHDNYIYMATFDTGYFDPSSKFDSGFIYSREKGIVGMWFGDKDKLPPQSIDNIKVYWKTPDSPDVYKCS